MIEIIKTLVGFGMDFEYENRGSDGETLTSFELDLRVSFQEGYIYMTHEGDDYKLAENDKNISSASFMVKQFCIDETASF
jgi:hypothetical protein